MLLKKQKGKCTECGLYFREGDAGLLGMIKLSGAENFSVLDYTYSSDLIFQKEKTLTFENSTCFSNFSRFLRDAQAGRILHHGIGTSLGSFKAL